MGEPSLTTNRVLWIVTAALAIVAASVGIGLAAVSIAALRAPSPGGTRA
jgi:hypothetical protein